MQAETGTRWIDKMFIQGIKDKDLSRVKKTLDGGADVESKDADGFPALILSIVHHAPEIAELLISRGADLQSREVNSDLTPLHRAASVGLVGVCKLMLERGADPNIRGAAQQTPLHFAANSPRGPDVVDVLVEYGAQVDAESSLKQTPLFNAAVLGSYDTAQALLRAGATIDWVDYRSSTPFKLVESNGKDKMCRFLIAHGADASDILVWKDMTRLEAAASGGFSDLMLKLMEGDTSHDLAQLKRMALACGERETAAILDAEMARHAISSISKLARMSHGTV